MITNKHVKILLVDDRNENLLALEVILSQVDYQCIKVNSGKEALKVLLQERDIAIILMDVQMPIMDGFETATLIRESEKFKYVPIIFLSGNMIAPEDIFKGYKTGAVDYMIKPLSSEILKAKVAVFVDLYKKNKELLAQEEYMKTLNSQLQKQSQYVRSLIEAGLDPLITINSEGRITDMNAALENITGIPRKKIQNTPFIDYFTKPERAREVYQETFAKGSIVDYLLTICHKDGTLIDVLCNGSVYKDDQGRVVGVVIVAIEKLLSKYARSLIEASLDPLITINFEGKITDMNEALAHITGISYEEIKGTNFFDYFTEQQKAREVYEQVFSKGFVVNSPLTLRHKEGKLTDVLFNGSVYKDNRGNILGAVIVARDVTSQKTVEKELMEAKSKAEDAMKSKQQFLSNMSHEIRTPMNAIIGFTKLMVKTELSEKQKEYINAIKVSGDTLIVLINDILDLAKVDAGKMTFEKIPFKLTDSVCTMLHLFDAKIQEKNLELIKQYDPTIPEFVVGDQVRLNQVILNLLSNAVKFTNEGKIIVAVNLLEDDTEKVTIEFEIKDSGIGIPANKLDKIFDKFQQAEGNTERLYGGTGLGLAIVKELVEAQGGRISVKSEVNEGAAFSVVLNFNKIDEKTEKEAIGKVEQSKNSSLEDVGLENISILIAEDVKLNQLLMKTLLEEAGCNIYIAPNGRIAIEKLGAGSKFDLVLMDLHMPEMDGFEATEYIRKTMNSDIPIIALTADVTTVDVEKCKEIGMNDYIAKPVDDKILYKKIKQHVKNSAQQKKNAGKENGYSDDKKYVYQIINLDYLKQLANNNLEKILVLIRTYLEETPKLLKAMKQGIDKEDWESVGTAAHSITPSFILVGIHTEYEEMARKIQQYAVRREKQETIKELISKIETICVLAIEELQHEIVVLELH